MLYLLVSNKIKMYNLYTDKIEEFKCQLEIEGADSSNSLSRIILESEKGLNLLFNGSVKSNGECVVPIDKLKNILNENDKGTIKLEIIADDTVFTPWTSDFVVKTSKKVNIVESSNLNENKATKPVVKVIINEQKNNLDKHVSNVKKILETANSKNKKIEINQILEAYSKHTSLTKEEINQIKTLI